MSKEPRPDKMEVYFNGALRRTITIYTPWEGDEFGDYLRQFQGEPGYEVYINGQLFDVGDVPLTK